MVLKQIHNKFKIFSGPLAADNTIGALGGQIESFVAEHKVAAKSIGVEYLESAKKLIISLGYREGDDGYAIKIKTVSLGKIGGLETGDTARLEEAMTAACEKIDDIICHELYITDDGDFLVVFMSHA
ncbi:MAG: hypothetical protein ABJE95_18070 [Byssovorax sp.]